MRYSLSTHLCHTLGTFQRPPTRHSTVKFFIPLSFSKYIPSDAHEYVALLPNWYKVVPSESDLRFMPSGKGGSMHWIHSQSSIWKIFFYPTVPWFISSATLHLLVLQVSMFYSIHNVVWCCRRQLYHWECTWQVSCLVHKCSWHMCCMGCVLPCSLCSNHIFHHWREEAEDQSKIVQMESSTYPKFLKYKGISFIWYRPYL